MLIDNFVKNSLEDALKIAKDLGIMMRVFEGIHSRQMIKVSIEANTVLHNVLCSIGQIDDCEQKEELFDTLLKLQSEKIMPMNLMGLLVENLKESSMM